MNQRSTADELIESAIEFVTSVNEFMSEKDLPGFDAKEGVNFCPDTSYETPELTTIAVLLHLLDGLDMDEQIMKDSMVLGISLTMQKALADMDILV